MGMKNVHFVFMSAHAVSTFTFHPFKMELFCLCLLGHIMEEFIARLFCSILQKMILKNDGANSHYKLKKKRKRNEPSR